MSNEQIRFIDRLYKDLYLDKTVIRYGSGNVYDKFNNIKAYMEKLEEIHTRISDTGRHTELLKKMYYDKYVIKPEDIPDSYYKHQQEIALERGYGHIEMTSEKKREYQEQIISDQRKSLDVWLEYFLSDDSKVYPFWAKYWAFQGMLKLGNYDKKTGEFSRRSKNTVAPFPDLNREALAISIDSIIKILNNEKIDDKKLESLVKNGSFVLIYTYILTNVLRDNTNITKRDEGRWVKYPMGSDHMPLVKSLQGYNTGWCTAGESTAKNQLSMGDFYVYYTLNEYDEYKVPRIAIRMAHGKIGEIRGVAPNQNIEPEMEQVVAEKIKDFPDRDKYYKKVNDMKLLTLIYKKQKRNEELTLEELKFLYEIECKIEGFGYEKDPRIMEIIEARNNIKKDLTLVYDYKEDDIALEKYEINNNTKLFYGSLNLSFLPNAEGLLFPQEISGNLHLNGLRNAEGLGLPQTIGGSLCLISLTSSKGLTLPQNIGGSLNLRSLTTSEGLKLPQRIGGSLNLSSLITAEGLELPQSIGESLDLRTLTTAEGLELPQSIGGSLNLRSLTTSEGLELPQSIGGSLDLRSLTTAEGLKLPQSIGGSLDLSSLTTAEGLELPQSIGGSLYLSSLTTAEGLELSQNIGGSLDLSSLTTAEGLKLPQNIGGSLYLNSLTTAEGLELPQSIGGSLDLRSLTTSEGLELPQNIRGYLELSSLTTLEGLELPQSVGGDLYLNSLAEGLVLPRSIGGHLYFDNERISSEDIHAYINKYNSSKKR